jgi:hypothetical protein
MLTSIVEPLRNKFGKPSRLTCAIFEIDLSLLLPTNFEGIPDNDILILSCDFLCVKSSIESAVESTIRSISVWGDFKDTFSAKDKERVEVRKELRILFILFCPSMISLETILLYCSNSC